MENHVIRMFHNRVAEFGTDEIIRFREKGRES